MLEDRRASSERRRWFASADLDLIVWFDGADSPIAFQLCYDKRRSERALTWKPETGFVHMVVDSGGRQDRLRYKATPILIEGGQVDLNRVRDLLSAECDRLPPAIVEFVATKLRQHPDAER